MLIQHRQIARETDDGVLLFVRVQSGASRSCIDGVTEDGRVKLKVCSKPIKGAANKECTAMLAKKLKIAKSKITLVGGIHSREKTFLLSGILKEDTMSAMGI